MTPAARVQTAIELLDEILAGAPAEKTMTGWARRSRFAGSKDRVAVRDHVFDALRQRNSAAMMGGGLTGRHLMLGLTRLQGIAADTIFTGTTYAPQALEGDELIAPQDTSAINLPDWIVPQMRDSLGEAFDPTEQALRSRAPVMLRVNTQRSNPENAILALKDEGISARKADIASTALIVGDGARRVSRSETYQDGLVELQDGSSQAAMEAITITKGSRVLDYCAGGGGKVLALAARHETSFYAYDALPQRMKDLPIRATRAGVTVNILSDDEIDQQAAFDQIICDVPCSGSGSWRRSPDAKWRFSLEDLNDINLLQEDILNKASALLAPGGSIFYCTCSVLDSENETQITKFIAQNPRFSTQDIRHWPVSAQGDGFFLASLKDNSKK